MHKDEHCSLLLGGGEDAGGGKKCEDEAALLELKYIMTFNSIKSLRDNIFKILQKVE